MRLLVLRSNSARQVGSTVLGNMFNVIVWYGMDWCGVVW